jgi:hypothetical protein
MRCRSAFPVADFWNRVEKTDGCWLWTRAKDRRGYGIFLAGKAHRFAWTLANGSIPDGLCVLHHCDNPSCVNPSHLFLGSQMDNVADKVKKGRQASGQSIRKNHEHLRGERQATARLTAQQVLEIRALYGVGHTQTELATRFDVSQGLISQIVLRKIWRHI